MDFITFLPSCLWVKCGHLTVKEKNADCANELWKALEKETLESTQEAISMDFNTFKSQKMYVQFRMQSLETDFEVM